MRETSRITELTEKMDISGKTVWITGASSGIGEHLAYECAKRGARLILSARRKEELERVGAKCSGSPHIRVLPMDLSSESAVREAVAGSGPVDVLIHCGGVSQRSQALETPIELDRRIMDINYFAPVLLTKLVAPGMIGRKSGHIIVISSLTGKWGFYLRSAYAASKHALHGFFESFRLENEAMGIRVTIVTPGFIATPISIHALNKDGLPTGEMDKNQEKGISPEECAQTIIERSMRGEEEFAVGGKELRALTLHRYFPRLFKRILRRQSAR